jgi:hypothetical protein
VGKVFKIVVDTHRLKRKLRDIWEQGELATRPAAQAGAQVYYDEVKIRAPVSEAPHFFYGRLAKGATTRTIYPFKPGDLRDSVYQVFSKDNSSQTKATYHIAWNHQVVPYGFMVEFGHRQTRKVYQGSDGYWYTSNALLEDGPKIVKPEPFLRPAADAKRSEAIQAAKERWIADMKKVIGQ